MTDLFSMGYEDKIREAQNSPMRRIRLLSLFSGIGAFEKALDNVGIPYELVAYCEIDKYASKAYSAIHGVSEDKNLWDVCKVDATQLGDIDLLTYGFPCQDISISGKMKGMFDEEGGYTRSGLFFEALRIIKECRPRIAIAENVRNLMSETFREQYHIVQESLDEAGYINHVQVLNAKDYGIPQNRERVFIVSIRKDIDIGYIFPPPVLLELCLRDLLEDKVDEKYYLPSETVKGFQDHRMRQEAQGNGFGWNPTDGGGIGKTITCSPSQEVGNWILSRSEDLATSAESRPSQGRSTIPMDCHLPSVPVQSMETSCHMSNLGGGRTSRGVILSDYGRKE